MVALQDSAIAISELREAKLARGGCPANRRTVCRGGPRSQGRGIAPGDKYEFEKDCDYFTELLDAQNEASRIYGGAKVAIEYYGTTEMATALAMVENNRYGKAVRAATLSRARRRCAAVSMPRLSRRWSKRRSRDVSWRDALNDQLCDGRLCYVAVISLDVKKAGQLRSPMLVCPAVRKRRAPRCNVFQHYAWASARLAKV